MGRECQNCSYWERYREGNDIGHCRRYAHVLVKVVTGRKRDSAIGAVSLSARPTKRLGTPEGREVDP